MRWLGGISDSVDMSLHKLWEMVKDIQGNLGCCNAWGRKESDMTEWPNNNKSKQTVSIQQEISQYWICACNIPSFWGEQKWIHPRFAYFIPLPSALHFSWQKEKWWGDLHNKIYELIIYKLDTRQLLKCKSKIMPAKVAEKIYEWIILLTIVKQMCS